jgi:hypothetical protein
MDDTFTRMKKSANRIASVLGLQRDKQIGSFVTSLHHHPAQNLSIHADAVQHAKNFI